MIDKHNKPRIYRIDDSISFRCCSLFEGELLSPGDCTHYCDDFRDFVRYYSCCQHGIHYHCTEHPELELEFDLCSQILKCPRCETSIATENLNGLRSRCLRMLNAERFKGAKLIRIDDWYTPEIKKEIEDVPSPYWAKAQVKTDKDGDTIVILYIGYQGEKDKAQFFIKPEKGQVTFDHKDLDPSRILAKVQVTLANSVITHSYSDCE